MNTSSPIRFLCNDQAIETFESPTLLVLDFLRQKQRLVGTKEGCKEGDCGACGVLLGEEDQGKIRYLPMTSCLIPLGDLQGKHLVTIEGLNLPHRALNPVQDAVASEGGTQCGFCTPGIIVSMTWLLLTEDREPTLDAFKRALSGHLCRCTGYGSLIRASQRLIQDFRQGGRHAALWQAPDRIAALIDAKMLPSYFASIPQRLRELAASSASPTHSGLAAAATSGLAAAATSGLAAATTSGLAVAATSGLAAAATSGPSVSHPPPIFLAGGTDLYVQKGEHLPEATAELLNAYPQMRGIREEAGTLYVGALTTFEDFGLSPLIRTLIPRIDEYLWLIASLQIRTRATLGGNIINASPIGDITNLLLALNSSLILAHGSQTRIVAMRDFFKGYKTLDRLPSEILTEIVIPAFEDGTHVHFEKVSKRTCLDIATVNASVRITVDPSDTIRDLHIALGGVAPIPLYLRKTPAALLGQPLHPDTLRRALPLVQTEIAPISDVRGSAEYKRLLAHQLLLAAFAEIFPTRISAEDLVA